MPEVANRKPMLYGLARWRLMASEINNRKSKRDQSNTLWKRLATKRSDIFSRPQGLRQNVAYLTILDFKVESSGG